MIKSRELMANLIKTKELLARGYGIPLKLLDGCIDKEFAQWLKDSEGKKSSYSHPPRGGKSVNESED